MDWPIFASPQARCDECRCFEQSHVIALPGEGSPQASIILVGEAPGEDEESRGRNFVGRAGQLLDRSIQEADLLRSELWICNSVRCRPTRLDTEGQRFNRTPEPHETVCCNGYLEDELLALPNRRVIVCLGGKAMLAVLRDEAPGGGVRENIGKVIWSQRFNCWVLIAVHPSYYLRRQAERSMLTFALIKARRYAQDMPPQPSPVEYRVIESVDEAIALRDYILRHADELMFDWETNGLHLTKSIGFALSLSIKEREAFVIPRHQSGMLPFWSHRDLRVIDQEVIQPILLSDIPKGGSNIGFDMSIAQTTVGVLPRNVDFDCMIAHHLLNNHLGLAAHGLKVMADLYTDMGRYDDPLDQWLVSNGYTKDGRPDGGYIYMAPNEMVWPYACADADASIRLKHVFVPRLIDEGLDTIFREERMPLVHLVQRQDRTGIRVNLEHAHRLSGELEQAMERTAAETAPFTPAGEPINPNSYPQVRTLLYDHLGLPIVARTDTMLPSTREEHLLQLKDMTEVIPIILRYRAYTKLKGYVDGRHGNLGILAVVDEDGYARINTIIPGTETLRFVTRKPFPLHTWPKTAPGMPSVRQMFMGDENHVIVSRDFDQQEWCIQAIAAEQWDMVEALLDRGEDVHELVARELGGIHKTEFVGPDGRWLSEDHQRRYKQLRSFWKSVNFMILFRGGAFKLALSIGIDEVSASEYISNYYERFDRIRWWQYERIKECRQTGRVRGLFGPYRIIPAVNDSSKKTQAEGERQACNFPIQNGGAHVMFRAMLRIDNEWTARRFPARILFSLHDQILASAHRDHAEEADADMKRIMESAYPELAGRSLRTSGDIKEWWE